MALALLWPSLADARDDDEPDLRTSLSGGLWYAKLSRPLMDDETFKKFPDLAPDAQIGEGTGLLTQVGFSASYLRHRVFVDYLTDKLFGGESPSGAKDKDKETFKFLTARLVPHVTRWWNPELLVTSGSIEGAVQDASTFFRHDGQRYVPSTGTWKADFFRLDARLGPLGLSHSRFGIPTVATVNDYLTIQAKYLIDSQVTCTEAVAAIEMSDDSMMLNGATWFYWRAALGIGWGKVDYGRWGNVTGGCGSMRFEGGFTPTIYASGRFFVRVRAAVSLEYLQAPYVRSYDGSRTDPAGNVIPDDTPLAGAHFEPPKENSATYLLWGPRFALEIGL